MIGTLINLRQASAHVAENARWVQINISKLMQYPESLILNAPMTHSSDIHWLGHGDDTLIYFLILDSINFGSGYFPYLNKHGSMSGYVTIANCLKEYFRIVGTPSPSDLTRFNLHKCAVIFGQDEQNPHASELMDRFALALNQLGEWLISQFDGDYLGFLKQSRSIQDAIDLLIGMPFFRDVATYGSVSLPFLKRAQILLHDMKIAEPNIALLDLEGFSELTVFPDNLLPFVLREDGILNYHPWLSERIEREELIGSDSPEEIEMRACSVHACEILKSVIVEELKEITSREIDYCLWHRAQRLKNNPKHPRHWTRCTYY
jgi:hypothetical protein